MLHFAMRGGVIAISLLVLTGCSKSNEPAPETEETAQIDATPAQLVDAIIEMSKTPDQYGETAERHTYTRTLNQMGPTALLPLIEYMAAPDTEDHARLFILQCVNDILTPYYLPDLKPMLTSEDQVIRAIGVTAVSSIDDPAVLPLLKQARRDERPRVAFSALSGMAMQGDPAAREELKSMYVNDGTMGDIPVVQIKREVVRALVRDAQESDLSILKDALSQPWVEVNYRAAIVRALGRLGGADDIPLLQASLDLQEEEAYAKLVQQAIASIQERSQRA
jgi:HEAT repeat protein